MIVNQPKAVLAALLVVALTVLLAIRPEYADAAFGLMGLIVGYAIGNGIEARNGRDAPPLIGSGRRDRRRTDRNPNSGEDTIG